MAARHWQWLRQCRRRSGDLHAGRCRCRRRGAGGNLLHRWRRHGEVGDQWRNGRGGRRQRSAYWRCVNHRHGNGRPGADGGVDAGRCRWAGLAALPVAARCRLRLRQCRHRSGDLHAGRRRCRRRGACRRQLHRRARFCRERDQRCDGGDRQHQRSAYRRRLGHRHDDREPGADGRYLDAGRSRWAGHAALSVAARHRLWLRQCRYRSGDLYAGRCRCRRRSAGGDQLHRWTWHSRIGDERCNGRGGCRQRPAHRRCVDHRHGDRGPGADGVSTLADVDGLGTLHYDWQHDVGGGFVNRSARPTSRPTRWATPMSAA